MSDRDLVINKLEGYSGIRLKAGKPLVFKPGINLLVGRNGSGKTNLLRLIQAIATNQSDLKERVESSYLLDRLKVVAKAKGKSFEARFGEVTLVEHRLRGKAGGLKMSLRNVGAPHVLRNIMADPTGIHGHLELSCKSTPVPHRYISGNESPPKFEMSGYVMSFNVLSGESGNKLHSMMNGPIQAVSNFVRAELTKFFESPDFISRMDELEKEINKMFEHFLGTTSKYIKISYGDIGNSGRVVLSVMDRGNQIRSMDLSTGESILLNLVFSLASAKGEGCDIMCLDEPDIHMHDDMIQVLVDELKTLSAELPDCIMIVASHSTALIERLAALGDNMVNIITFDNDRKVGNSKSDLELINALHRNGVGFSPLMLSRKLNIFIENRFQKEDRQRTLFSKFFPADGMPNIIPIGASVNVQDSDSFTDLFQEILRISKIKSVGVQDGDIWLKPLLVDYLSSKASLTVFLMTLKAQKGVYIKGDKGQNSYFFNFWEIENLFLKNELLSCWRSKHGTQVLTKETYLEFLRQNKEAMTKEYLDFFFKAVTRIRAEKNHSISRRRALVAKRFAEMDKHLSDESLSERLVSLTDALIDGDLLNWVPGKEIKSLLERNGYSFEDSQFDYVNCTLSKQVRKILRS